MAASGAWVGTIGAGGGNWEGARAELLRPGLSAGGEVMDLDLSVGWGAGWGAGAVVGKVVFLPMPAEEADGASLSDLAALTAAGAFTGVLESGGVVEATLPFNATDRVTGAAAAFAAALAVALGAVTFSGITACITAFANV